MIQYQEIREDISTYCHRNSRNNRYRPKCCPHCQYGKMYRHGWRKRYIVTGKREYQIEIPRFRCPHCRRTVTVLPDFLSRRFSHTIGSIINTLQAILRKNIKIPYRQLADFYKNRFLQQINKVFLYFRDTGWKEELPVSGIEKAIKAVDLVHQTHKEGFTTSYFLTLNQHFMAK